MMKEITFIIFILVSRVLTSDPTGSKTKRSFFQPSSWSSYSNHPDYGSPQEWQNDENQWKNTPMGQEALQSGDGWANLEEDVTASAPPTSSPVVVSKQIVLEKKVPVYKPFIIERKIPVPVEKIIRVPYEKIVNKAIAVPVPQPIPYPVERPVQVPVRQTIAVPVRQPYAVPVRQGVPYPVPVPVLLTPQGLVPVPSFMLPALQNALRSVFQNGLQQNGLQSLYQNNMRQQSALQHLYQNNLQNNMQTNYQHNFQNDLQKNIQNNFHNDIHHLQNNLQKDLENLQNNLQSNLQKSLHSSLQNELEHNLKNNLQNNQYLPPLSQSNGDLAHGYPAIQGFNDINDLGLVPPPSQEDDLAPPVEQVQDESLPLDFSPPISRNYWSRQSPLIKWKRSSNRQRQYREKASYQNER